MRGIYTPVTDIRRKVFTEVARMAYEVTDRQDIDYLMRELPYEIIPGEERSLRSSIFLERAIVSERIRLAMGLSLRPLDESVSASEGLDSIITADKYYEPPLINVIKYACNKCPEKLIKVTSLCQGCLAHPCQEVCPKRPSASATARATSTRACASSAAAAWPPAPTTPSCVWSAPAPRPAAWTPFIPTSTAVPRSTTTSA